MGFNNDGAEAVLRRLAARAHLGGIVGVNVGANKDAADRVADYVKLIENLRAGRELFHRQRLVAEYAGPAQSAAGRRARRSPGQGDRCARTGAAERRRFAGAAQDRARPQPRRTRRCRAYRSLAPHRRHDRRPIPRWRGPRPCASRPVPRSRADCRAGRCSGCRRAWWRRPMCARRARFR